MVLVIKTWSSPLNPSLMTFMLGDKICFYWYKDDPWMLEHQFEWIQKVFQMRWWRVESGDGCTTRLRMVDDQMTSLPTWSTWSTLSSLTSDLENSDASDTCTLCRTPCLPLMILSSDSISPLRISDPLTHCFSHLMACCESVCSDWSWSGWSRLLLWCQRHTKEGHIHRLNKEIKQANGFFMVLYQNNLKDP